MSALFTVGQIVAVYLTRKPEVFRCAKVVYAGTWTVPYVCVHHEANRFDAFTGLEMCRGFRKRRIAIATPEQLASQGMLPEQISENVERWEAARAVHRWLAKVHSGEAPIGDVRKVLAMIGGEK